MNTRHQPPKAFPSTEMSELLIQLAAEDAQLPDPTTLLPQEGRELARTSNLRWNLDPPPMAAVDTLIFEGTEGHTIKARLYTPEVCESGLIVFIHGGGFAFCDLDTHDRHARLLATESKCMLLSIDYLLAPEYPYPAGLNDCIDVFRQLAKVRSAYPQTQGHTTVAGDSAGANLALALILNEQAKSRIAPDFALLFYGVFGTDFNTRSYREFEYGPGLTRAKMMRYMDWYVDSDQRNDPLVSPVLATDDMLLQLPPMYFNAAEIDPLCSDTQNLVARLHGLGREDQLQICPGVVHGFMQMTLRLPAAHRATTDAADALRKFTTQYNNNSTTTRTPR